VLDIGCAPGCMSRELRGKQVKTIALDRTVEASTREHAVKVIESDVETYDFSDRTKVDTVLLLDIVEHLVSPEQFLRRLRQRYSGDGPDIVITTANVAFLPIRLALLFGQFNYNRRGILDLTHTRLFTFSSLRRMLMQNGYEIVSVKGLPAPYPLAIGDGMLARTLLRLNRLAITLSKGLFSYQIAMVVRLKPTLTVLLGQAQQTGAEKLADHQGHVPTPTSKG
jgi:SAM-dependent methyltransferase